MKLSIKYCQINLFMWVFALNAGFDFESSDSTLTIKTLDSRLVLRDQINGFSGRLRLAPGDYANQLQGDNPTAQNYIVFNGGNLDIGYGDTPMSGTFTPGSASYTTDASVLNSSNIGFSTNALAASASGGLSPSSGQLTLNSKPLNRPLTIASGQTFSLSGTPQLTQPISLSSSTSTLNLAVTNRLAQNISLGGGTVVLNEDLSFKDGCFFAGTGKVDVNGRKLVLGARAPQYSIITFVNAKDIALSDNQTTNGSTTTFTGTGQYSLIEGNGYTWTLTGGAKFRVDPNHALYLTNIRIKGLGQPASNGFFDIDPTSTIYFANTTLELVNTYTSIQGTLNFSGENCTLINRGYTFTVTNSSSYLVVDSVSLLYDTLDQTDQSPFFYGNQGQNLVLSNNGTIRTAKGGGGGGSGSGESAIVVNGTTQTLAANQRLTATTGITINNATPASPVNVTLDGGNYYIQFPNTSGAFLTLAQNVQLTLQNVVLKDFNPAAISFGASSTITFGANVRIELGSNLSITGAAGNPAWAFNGSATINGMGHTLTLPNANMITVTGANNLTLKSLNIYTNNASAMANLTSTATIQLEDDYIYVDQAGLSITTGNLNIAKHTRIRGTNTTTAAGNANFTYNSASTSERLTVLSGSTLEIGENITFNYLGTGSGDLKRRLYMQDYSSCIFFNGCSLATGTGMAIDRGRVKFDNKVAVTASQTVGQEFEIGSAADVQVCSAALVSFDGLSKYILTT